jgi:hypothetical protein
MKSFNHLQKIQSGARMRNDAMLPKRYPLYLEWKPDRAGSSRLHFLNHNDSRPVYTVKLLGPVRFEERYTSWWRTHIHTTSLACAMYWNKRLPVVKRGIEKSHKGKKNYL